MASNEGPLPDRAVHPGAIEAASERLEAYLKNRQLSQPAAESQEDLSSSDEAPPPTRADGDVAVRQADETEAHGGAMVPGARRITPFWIKAALAIAVVVAAAEGAYIAWGARSAEAPATSTVERARAEEASKGARLQAPPGGDAAPTAAQTPVTTPRLATATTGTIEVRTTPPGATVVFRGRRRGVTPLTISSVPPGMHDVEVGGWFGSRIQRITVRPGRTSVVDLTVPQRRRRS